jgi:hypothetical protein
MGKTALLALLLSTALAISCSKTGQPEPDMGYNYFPLATGHYVIYEVDSIDYNAFTNSVDTFRFEVKELVGEEFIDNASRPSKRVYRYYRQSPSQEWDIHSVSIVTLLKERLEKVENNQRFIKLIFPVREGMDWKGNSYTSLPSWEYEFRDADKPKEIRGIAYDSTVTVQLVEDENLIEAQNYKEIYARNIGLAAREIVDIKTEVDGTIKSGLKFYQRIKSHGMEK